MRTRLGLPNPSTAGEVLLGPIESLDSYPSWATVSIDNAGRFLRGIGTAIIGKVSWRIQCGVHRLRLSSQGEGLGLGNDAVWERERVCRGFKGFIGRFQLRCRGIQNREFNDRRRRSCRSGFEN